MGMVKIKPKSFHLQWHITERCNLRCKHCYQDPTFLKQELDTQKLIQILENFIKQIKAWGLSKEMVRVSLTGGEPFMRKDFFELLKKYHENRFMFNYGILTNGTLLNKKIVKELKNLEVNYVQVSLEGTEKINDYIRGKGVFKKVIQTVKLLKNEGLNSNLSMTVSKANIKEVPKMVNLSKRLGVPLGIRRLVPSGRAKMMKNLLLTPKEVQRLWHYVLKLRHNFGIPIGLGCEDGMLVQDFPQYYPGECSAGYVSFTVLPNGDVYPCRRLAVYAGNLLKQSFKAIYYDSKILRKLRNLNNINDICYACPYYERCHGGAKCIAFGYFQDFSAPDPQCWRLFEKLPSPDLKWRNSSKKREKKLSSKWIAVDG